MLSMHLTNYILKQLYMVPDMHIYYAFGILVMKICHNETCTHWIIQLSYDNVHREALESFTDLTEKC